LLAPQAFWPKIRAAFGLHEILGFAAQPIEIVAFQPKEAASPERESGIVKALP
jgi:hypothetical protein